MRLTAHALSDTEKRSNKLLDIYFMKSIFFFSSLLVVERISEISDIRSESDYFWDIRIRLFEVKYISDIIRIRHMTIRVFVKYSTVKIWMKNCTFSCEFQENFCKKCFFSKKFFPKKIFTNFFSEN